jgi:transcriptional regulator with XRE-family HTH domain
MNRRRNTPNKAGSRFPYQNPHGGNRAGRLEQAIGNEVRRSREKLNLTMTELAKAAKMSVGMLSKVENAKSSLSLASLESLAQALQVPVTSLFRSYEEVRDATFVKAGEGLKIERRGTRAGHQYQLLGHTRNRPLIVEPYLITLSETSDVFPVFQHDGIEFLYILEGEVGYRHGDKVYRLAAGDSLFFDADVPHGPEELRKLPIRFLSIISHLRDR